MIDRAIILDGAIIQVSVRQSARMFRLKQRGVKSQSHATTKGLFTVTDSESENFP